MKIHVSELTERQPLERIIVHALDNMLYQVLISTEGKEGLLYGEDGKPYRTRSVRHIRTLFSQYQYKEVVFRQSSAYDEMIGQPVRETDNTLELPLFWDKETADPMINKQT